MLKINVIVYPSTVWAVLCSMQHWINILFTASVHVFCFSVSALSVKGPRFNSEPGVFFIYKLLFAAIAVFIYVFIFRRWGGYAQTSSACGLRGFPSHMRYLLTVSHPGLLNTFPVGQSKFFQCCSFRWFWAHWSRDGVLGTPMSLFY